MRPASLIYVLTMAAICGGCVSVSSNGTQEHSELATAKIQDSSGQEIGEARLVSVGKGLAIAIALQGLNPGEKGFHLHESGRCDPPDFATAGGHLNPLQKQHGLRNPAGHHLGDLPNISISFDGTFSQTIPLAGETTALIEHIFDPDGTAIVIHKGPDDYRSDPAGNAGPRIACGVIERLAANP